MNCEACLLSPEKFKRINCPYKMALKGYLHNQSTYALKWLNDSTRFGNLRSLTIDPKNPKKDVTCNFINGKTNHGSLEDLIKSASK